MFRQALALLTGVGSLVLVRTALAEQPPETDRASSEAKPAVGEPPALSVKRFNLLASVGYGASTASVGDLEMKPYGTSGGIDIGYTFTLGLRLGAYGTYGTGNEVTNRIESGGLRGDRDVTIDASTLNTGLSFGYDVALDFFVLRYTLNAGVTFMRYEFDGASARAAGYEDENSPATGFHFAPGATLLVRRGRFESGIGFDYFVQANGAIPNGFLGKIQIGVGL